MTVAVVTGASKGLGRGIAVALADAGFDVVIGYRSADAEAKDTATLVNDTGRQSAIVAGDVSVAETHLALTAAAEELGAIDVWVNNAGVSILAPVAATDARDFARMIDVNLVGTLLGLQAAVSAMRAHGKGGRVINIASELGVQAFPYLGAYSATKFAVVGLTQAAALELAAEQITVNAVCPGTAETDMVASERRAEAALTAQSVDEVRTAYLAGIPSGRFCAPDDVGALVAYLASPGAAYVTGQSICVNGGSVLR